MSAWVIADAVVLILQATALLVVRLGARGIIPLWASLTLWGSVVGIALVAILPTLAPYVFPVILLGAGTVIPAMIRARRIRRAEISHARALGLRALAEASDEAAGLEHPPPSASTTAEIRAGIVELKACSEENHRRARSY